MELPPTFLDGVEAHGVVAIGTADPSFVLPVQFAAAEVRHIEDRARLAEAPQLLGAELDRLDFAFDVVLDHADDREPSVALELFQTVFGRVPSDGTYLIHGPTPTPLVTKLMLATVVAPTLVDSVGVVPGLIAIRRGSSPWTDDSIDLAKLPLESFVAVAP